MAWFSGKVTLGNFADIVGAVNKFSGSEKNIEKNFETALGFEDKADGTTSTNEDKASGHIHDCQTWYIQDFDKKALEANYGKPLPLYQKALCELTAGTIGECVRSPADLALIHMQAPDSHVFYILMTNIYSSKERWIERAETIRLMKKVGVAKDTGTSWIEMECIALVMYYI